MSAKAGWLRIHLLTVVVLTIVAGALLYGNLVQHEIKDSLGNGSYRFYGWPCATDGEVRPAHNVVVADALVDDPNNPGEKMKVGVKLVKGAYEADPFGPDDAPGDAYTLGRNPKSIVINIAVGILILISTACVLEFLARPKRRNLPRAPSL